MNLIPKYLAVLVVLIAASYFYLEPIVTHEDKYKVVIVNKSEYKISSVEITGPGENIHEMGIIKKTRIQDYIFEPEQDGSLEYFITQNGQEIRGTINNSLKKNEAGDIYVVLGERYKVKVYDEYDI